MLDKKVSELLNNQINKEFYSAYLYPGLFQIIIMTRVWTASATGLRFQAQEERDQCHAVYPVYAEQRRKNRA